MGRKTKKIFALRITTVTVARDHLNLLKITAVKKSHYVLVESLSRLVSRQYNVTKIKYFSQYCLHGCTSEEVLKNHMERCKLHGAQIIKLPEAGNKKGCDEIKFTKTVYNYFYLLSSRRISKAYYVNKTHVNHRHQNPLPPNTSITYHRTMWELHLREMQ